MVLHEADERFWASVGRTRSDRFLVIGVGLQDHHGVPLLDADDPTGEFRVVAPRRQGVEYGVEHAVIAGEDVLLVLHNDGAENFMLAQAPVDATTHEQWQPVLEHDPAVRLEDVDAFAGHLVVSQRSDGLTQLRVITARRADGSATTSWSSSTSRLHRGRGRQPGVPPAHGPARLHHDGHSGRGLRLRRAHPAS